MKTSFVKLGIMFDYYRGNYSVDSVEARLHQSFRDLREFQRRIEKNFPRDQYIPLERPFADCQFEYVHASFAAVFVEKLRDAQFPLGEKDYGAMYSAIWELVNCADDSELSLRIALATEHHPAKKILYEQIKKNAESLNRGIESLKDFPAGPPAEKYFIRYGVREKPQLYIV